MNKAIGIILIAAGIVLVMWAGFTYPQKNKTTTSLQVFDDTDKNISYPLYIGGFFLAGGITIMIMSKKDDKIW